MLHSRCRRITLFGSKQPPNKLKLAVGVGFGSAIGSATFPLLRGTEIDWLHAVFVGAFSFLVFLVIPKRVVEVAIPEPKREPNQAVQGTLGRKSSPSAEPGVRRP